jgi:putative membrane protein
MIESAPRQQARAFAVARRKTHPPARPWEAIGMTSSKVNEHMANERTFLAWVRTALGLIGLGFVLARMGLFLRQIAITAQGLITTGHAHDPTVTSLAGSRHAGHEFVISGVVFLAIGIIFCGWSGWAYLRNRQAIQAEQFEPASRSVIVLTAVVVLGGLVLIGLVLWKTLGNDV